MFSSNGKTSAAVATRRRQTAEPKLDPKQNVKNTSTQPLHDPQKKSTKISKTYNSRYSPIVTDLTTNLPIYSLYMGERTGSLVLCSLWSYVGIGSRMSIYITRNSWVVRTLLQTITSIRPAKSSLNIKEYPLCNWNSNRDLILDHRSREFEKVLGYRFSQDLAMSTY